MADPLFLCCIWNDRMHLWVEIASSFDRGRVVDLAAHCSLADCRVEVAVSASDTQSAIVAAIDALRPPVGSFAAMMTEIESEVSPGGGRRACLARRSSSLDE